MNTLPMELKSGKHPKWVAITFGENPRFVAENRDLKKLGNMMAVKKVEKEGERVAIHFVPEKGATYIL